MSFVTEYFSLNAEALSDLAQMVPDFGYNGFGEIVFYRTYSRLKADGRQENWHDVCVRVINGTMTIRKDWYCKNGIEWDEVYWQRYAYRMLVAMFKMHWLPAGRGMWAMGTQFIYERGAMALNNCGATKLGGNDRLADDLHWMMDALMLGVGVGFEALRDDLKIYKPVGTFIHYIGDSREGWCDALKMLVQAYTMPGKRKPVFKDDHVRKRGSLIRGFGGQSSGPGPLMKMLRDVEELFEKPDVDVVRLKTDIANWIGVCVVAGNVRRSAELGKGSVNDPVFMDLKDYDKYPEREDWGYMSNNSAALMSDADFEMIGEIAKRVITRGEPGILNLRNFKYGRIGKQEQPKPDDADIINPCGEIPLEDKELCNVVETLPTRCPSIEAWYEACEFASFYAATVSLLPTHRSETNRVVVRNRRIGVSIIDWTGWVHTAGLHKVTAYMRRGYKIVVETATRRNAEAGVPAPIRFTTIKPGGTGPKLPGKTPGAGYPTFRETLRRMRVAADAPVVPVLDAANVPFQPCYFDPVGTRIYEYPTLQGPADPADEVSLWEQATNLVTLAREWADNAVSNTLYFRPMWKLVKSRSTFVRNSHEHNGLQLAVEHDRLFLAEFDKHIKDEWGFNPWPGATEQAKAFKVSDERQKLVVKKDRYGAWELYMYEFDPLHEERHIEKVLSAIVPLIKSCSVLPHSAKGAYRQMPEEGISRKEYEERLSKIGKLDWARFTGSDGQDEKFCSAESCEVPK